MTKKREYLTIICTNCGFTSKTPYWNEQISRTKFIKLCYNCNPNYNKKRKKI